MRPISTSGTTPAPAPSRGRGDEGAVLLEFALVAPLLIMLVFGLIDFGRMLNEDNLLTRSVQSAARTGASQGTDRFADYDVLQSIQASLSVLDNSTIERVVVFQSTTADGKVPNACVTMTLPNDLNPHVSTGSKCNVYSPAQVNYAGSNLLTKFPATATCAGGWDEGWCPQARSRGSDTTDPDYLGVYVKLKSQPLTGVVGLKNSTLTSTSVFRLDPCITGVSCG